MLKKWLHFKKVEARDKNISRSRKRNSWSFSRRTVKDSGKNIEGERNSYILEQMRPETRTFQGLGRGTAGDLVEERLRTLGRTFECQRE